MQPALVASLATSVIVVLIAVALAVEGLLACVTVQPSLAVWCFAYLCFMTWSLGGMVIESLLALQLMKFLHSRNYAAMEMVYARTAARWRALPLRKGGRFGLICSNMGLMQILQGKYDDAEPNLREAIKLIETDRRLRNHYVLSVPMLNLAGVFAAREQYEEAEELAKKSLAIAEKGRSKNISMAAFPLGLLGRIYLKQKRLDEAETCLTQAQNLLLHANAPFLLLRESIETGKVSCLLGLAILRGEQNRARDCVELSISLSDTLAQNNQSLTVNEVEGIAELAAFLITYNEQKLAEHLIEHAYSVASHQSDHPDTPLLQTVYSDMLSATGRAHEIPDMRRWVRPVLMDIPLISKQD
jgi:tetratricopeptide (TPR) repeat protein